MEIIQANLFYVVKRFPGHKDTILKLFKENQNFHTICDDYWQCAQALKGWNQSDSKDAPARRKEYTNLLHELELEIRQYLNKHS